MTIGFLTGFVFMWGYSLCKNITTTHQRWSITESPSVKPTPYYELKLLTPKSVITNKILDKYI